jgi:signal transduction histidine kinase
VLRELLDNAVRFSDTGDTLMHVNTANNQPFAIDVSNDAPHIEVGDQARIFEPFERGEPAAERDDGARLGLYLARKLTDQLCAHLSVRSGPDTASETDRGTRPRSSATRGLLCGWGHVPKHRTSNQVGMDGTPTTRRSPMMASGHDSLQKRSRGAES